MCSTPPTTKKSPLSVAIACAAVCNAAIEEPHKRFTVCAATVCGITLNKAAFRATLKPCSRVWLTQPQITSSTWAGLSSGFRAKRPSITAADKFSARTFLKAPPLQRPMAERAPSTTTMSLACNCMFFSEFS